MKHLPSVWVRDALWALGYVAVFFVAFRTAHLFWFLPAGVRFAALLLSPYRRWSWLIAAELLLVLAMYTVFVRDQGAYGVVLVAGPTLLAACGPWWLRRSGGFGSPVSFGAMAFLLAAMALAATGATLVNVFYPFSELQRLSPLRVSLQLLLGDYIGMLALVPLAFMLVRERPNAATLRRWRLDVPVVLLPALLLYLVLVSRASEAQTFFLSASLCSVPSIYFAVCSGWRGAALALLATTLVVAYGGILAGNIDLTVEAQGFLAIVGSASLLLGASRDALVGSKREVEQRNAVLAIAGARQQRLASELRDAAQRNLNMAEQTRRWITSELHDEIGQNLAALQARVRLLERKADLEGDELSAQITQILASMRRTVSGLMSTLRPAGLDEFGLVHALEQGVIRSLLEAQGVACDVRIDDSDHCLARLDDNANTAIYRIVQEAATNTVRHADAIVFRVRLRARKDHDGYRVLLALHDDGRGFAGDRRTGGIGLLGIRDRVISLGGNLRLRSGAFGMRLQVRLRFVDAGRV